MMNLPRTSRSTVSFRPTRAHCRAKGCGYRSIRQGLRELAYDIKGMLALGGVSVGLNAP